MYDSVDREEPGRDEVDDFADSLGKEIVEASLGRPSCIIAVASQAQTRAINNKGFV